MDTASAPQPRALDASRGATWLQQGFELFKKAPGPWIAAVLVLFVIYAVASVIPGGGLLTSLFTQVVFAGLMLGCASLDGGGELKIEHLFAAFRNEHFTQLLIAGALYLGGVLIIVVVVGVVVGGSMMPMLWSKSDVNITQ